jgi:molybdenum cofactor cytidylyltransferase
MKTGIIILAAGQSKRMGVPKQLLDINGELMLIRVIKEALKLDDASVTVVLGAHKELITPKLKEFPISIMENNAWETGMASSIIRGLAGAYIVDKTLEQAIICTADMPEITSQYFEQLIKIAEETERIIVASKYQNAMGVPALFKKEMFNKLLDLKGDEGARQIFKKNKENMITLNFPGLGIDLDTKEDYLNYLNA